MNAAEFLKKINLGYLSRDHRSSYTDIDWQPAIVQLNYSEQIESLFLLIYAEKRQKQVESLAKRSIELNVITR